MRENPPKPEITRDALRQSLANAALEGLVPDAETLADLEARADGNHLSGDGYRERPKGRYGNP